MRGYCLQTFFATGDRTDKGIVGILSGYPSQPTKSIIKFTGKNSKLPNIAYDLKELGYYTSFFMGVQLTLPILGLILSIQTSVHL